jgi:hypothetical protein
MPDCEAEFLDSETFGGSDWDGCVGSGGDDGGVENSGVDDCCVEDALILEAM